MSYISRMTREEVLISRDIQTYLSMSIATEKRLNMLKEKLADLKKEKERLRAIRNGEKQDGLFF